MKFDDDLDNLNAQQKYFDVIPLLVLSANSLMHGSI